MSRVLPQTSLLVLGVRVVRVETHLAPGHAKGGAAGWSIWSFRVVGPPLPAEASAARSHLSFQSLYMPILPPKGNHCG